MEDKLSMNNNVEDKTSNKRLSQHLIEPKSVGIIYNRKTRWLIFILLMITNLFVNMDHGSIPAATTEIKRDLNINNDVLGILGSLVYFGNVIGSLLFFTIIGTF